MSWIRDLMSRQKPQPPPAPLPEATCKHCGRWIRKDGDLWVHDYREPVHKAEPEEC